MHPRSDRTKNRSLKYGSGDGSPGIDHVPLGLGMSKHEAEEAESILAQKLLLAQSNDQDREPTHGT